MRIYPEPEEEKSGDFIPLYANGAWHLFYLEGRPCSWRHLSTTNLVDYADHGTAIPSGGEGSQDHAVATGCVIEKGGTFHAFYTGHNANWRDIPGRFDWVQLHATSPDLISWTKDPDWRLPPDLSRYGAVAWRDPCVIWNDEAGEYWMVLAAQVKKDTTDEVPRDGSSILHPDPHGRLGCTALLTSQDLVEWQTQDPIWSPGLFDTTECPDLFRIGEWWYLIFSQYHDVWITRYRMARDPRGPWTAPADDCFDGRAFYAAKTATDGRRRILFGWTSGKEEDRDDGRYLHGGCLMAHELVQRSDGTLAARIPAEIQDAFSTAVPLAPAPSTGNWNVAEGRIAAEARDGFSALLLGTAPGTCIVETTAEWIAGTKAIGVLVRAKKDLDDTYLVGIQPGSGLLTFDRWRRGWDYPWMERPLRLSGNRAVIRVVVSDTVICVCVNDDIVLSGRVYDLKEGSAGLFVSEGGRAVFNGTSLRTMAG